MAPLPCWLQGFYSVHTVPIIENTARECELTDRLRDVIQRCAPALFMFMAGRLPS